MSAGIPVLRFSAKEDGIVEDIVEDNDNSDEEASLGEEEKEEEKEKVLRIPLPDEPSRPHMNGAGSINDGASSSNSTANLPSIMKGFKEMVFTGKRRQNAEYIIVCSKYISLVLRIARCLNQKLNQKIK